MRNREVVIVVAVVEICKQIHGDERERSGALRRIGDVWLAVVGHDPCHVEIDKNEVWATIGTPLEHDIVVTDVAMEDVRLVAQVVQAY